MTETIAVPRAALGRIIALGTTEDTGLPILDEAWAEILQVFRAAPEAEAEAVPEPPLPAGEYARVEIMGHDYETGWVTDGIRAGVPVLVIRDWDGRVLREVPGQSLYQFVPLATPLKRPDAPMALAGGFGGVLAQRAGGDPWADPDGDDDEKNPF